MADVNANVDTEDDGSSNHDKDPMDDDDSDDDSDDNIEDAGPSNKKGPAPKISFSHVHREFEVSIFFTS